MSMKLSVGPDGNLEGLKQVIVCDDHQIVREALRIVIESEGDLKVAAFATDGEQLITMVAALLPDLVILDIEMSGLGGIISIQRLVESHPSLGILVFSAHEERELIKLLSTSGADGFVGKSESASQILPAARAVLAGGRWFPDWIMDGAGDGASRDGAGRDGTIGDGLPEADELRRLRSLTPREREVLDLFASGLRTKAVADQLGMRPATVYTHVRNAVHKLNVSSRTQAVVIAARYEYLSESPRQS